MAALFLGSVSLFILMDMPYFAVAAPQMANAVHLTGDALCLDGTNGLYYIHEGSESSKYILNFQGGGVCSGLSEPPSSCFDACYNRSQTNMGSTKNDKEQMDLNQGAPPYLSDDRNVNPLMANWNHIFVRYCDGGFYAGNRSEPDTYLGQKIYYRGSRITKQIFSRLFGSTNYTKPTDIVIAGCSAGAQAIYININIMVSYLSNLENINLFTIADSGFIIDFNGINDDTMMDLAQNISFYEHNMTGSVDQRCVYDMPNKYNLDPYHCLFPQYNSKYIDNENINFFALQAQFDAFQIGCVLGSNDENLIEEFGMNLTNFVNHSLLLNAINHGAMIDSCKHHCGGWNTINLNGVTQQQAFSDFYQNHKVRRVWYQNQTYPCNSCCTN